jgi:hypothetical protein
MAKIIGTFFLQILVQTHYKFRSCLKKSPLSLTSNNLTLHGETVPVYAANYLKPLNKNATANVFYVEIIGTCNYQSCLNGYEHSKGLGI